MKKKINFSIKGQRADIGSLTIYRMLSNNYRRSVGPFVFLDHIVPMHAPSLMNSGTGAHPHRGIATLSYIIEGEDEHFDSAGNYAKVYSGGVQWMKAGNGIIHDETLNVDSRTGTNTTHAFQFWINLPAKNKAEKPAYLAIQSDEVPKMNLSENSGWIKVIAGAYENLVSSIPSYSEQFLYHIQVTPKRAFTITIDEKIEVAAFLPNEKAIINNVKAKSGEFVSFDSRAGEITIENKEQRPSDILLFGGEPYAEPMVAEGPFVMNSRSEIIIAYQDFYAGKYGTINYR
ncbi:pirin family protein [Belliella sp. DSM 111904]|uniref:Pirin family protein n=1 Tax=Belliella filtrata TaxID=2923435 RepID=A0ABS9UVF4_9BACT|nr:pirin family protein [Belliella filtrata]MCH7407783.1 pirin family protein [Belliella filtrata]